MPLKKGSSRNVVSYNIREMVRAGHPQRSAVAAALRMARLPRKKADGGEVDDTQIDPLTGVPLSTSDAAQARFNKVANGLLSGAKDWVTLPKRAMDEGITTDQAVNWAAPTALGMVGASRLPGGVPEGAVGAAGGKLVQPEGIRAYHGSPHDFDRFDLSKIGTGEGAQAYGHGLYFAENEGVARGYRDALTRDTDRTLESGGRLPRWVANSLEAGRNPAELLNDFRGRVSEAREAMKTAADPWNYPGKIEGLEGVASAIEKYTKGERFRPDGRMYEVNINAHPDQFLDWDKPLMRQSPEVQQFIAQHPQAPRLQGNDVVRGQLTAPTGEAILSRLGRDAEASQSLREAGIPGIKYLDQGSRAAGDGSRNYVLFNDKLIDILRKYGLAGLTTGAGVSEAMNNQSQPRKRGGAVNRALRMARQGRADGGAVIQPGRYATGGWIYADPNAGGGAPSPQAQGGFQTPPMAPAPGGASTQGSTLSAQPGGFGTGSMSPFMRTAGGGPNVPAGGTVGGQFLNPATGQLERMSDSEARGVYGSPSSVNSVIADHLAMSPMQNAAIQNAPLLQGGPAGATNSSGGSASTMSSPFSMPSPFTPPAQSQPQSQPQYPAPQTQFQYPQSQYMGAPQAQRPMQPQQAPQTGGGYSGILSSLNLGHARGGAVKQAKRLAKADGGGTPFYVRAEARGLERSGMIHSPVAGRTDQLPMSVSPGSYVVPADTLSGIGQGNSMAGANAMNQLLKMGPYGSAPGGGINMPGVAKSANIMRQQFADGGDASMMPAPPDDTGPGDDGSIPIVAAGGEYVIPPHKVAELGGGDLNRGHGILDEMVKHIRKRTIKTLRKLPGPKRD